MTRWPLDDCSRQPLLTEGDQRQARQPATDDQHALDLGHMDRSPRASDATLPLGMRQQRRRPIRQALKHPGLCYVTNSVGISTLHTWSAFSGPGAQQFRLDEVGTPRSSRAESRR
jgi:hypothetical protein